MTLLLVPLLRAQGDQDRAGKLVAAMTLDEKIALMVALIGPDADHASTGGGGSEVAGHGWKVAPAM